MTEKLYTKPISALWQLLSQRIREIDLLTLNVHQIDYRVSANFFIIISIELLHLIHLPQIDMYSDTSIQKLPMLYLLTI